MSDNKFHFGRVLDNIARLKRELPIALANQAQLHFTESFTQQGYEGHQWQEVKRRIPGTTAYKYPMNKGLSRRTSAILVRSGALRRAANMSIRTVSWEITRLVIEVPYARAQNEGTTTAGRNHNVVIPARPFMKDTQKLRGMQIEKINQFIDKIWQ